MPYLTPAEVREKVPDLSSEDTYPDEDLEEYIAEFEEVAEGYCGVAFLPRVSTWTGRSGVTVILPEQMVTEITAVTADGAALTEDQITALDLDAVTGQVHDWHYSGTSVFTYTHGYADPPPGILRACAEYVRAVALERDSGVPRNAASWSDGQGGTYRTFFVDPDNGQPTGLTTVDRVLNTYRRPDVAVA